MSKQLYTLEFPFAVRPLYYMIFFPLLPASANGSLIKLMSEMACSIWMEWFI
jgi:hypothetical protein